MEAATSASREVMPHLLQHSFRFVCLQGSHQVWYHHLTEKNLPTTHYSVLVRGCTILTCMASSLQRRLFELGISYPYQGARSVTSALAYLGYQVAFAAHPVSEIAATVHEKSFEKRKLDEASSEKFATVGVMHQPLLSPTRSSGTYQNDGGHCTAKQPDSTPDRVSVAVHFDDRARWECFLRSHQPQLVANKCQASCDAEGWALPALVDGPPSLVLPKRQDPLDPQIQPFRADPLSVTKSL